MTPFHTLCLRFALSIILLFFPGFKPVFADNPCETFVVKALWYTLEGKQDSGYIFLNRYQDGAMVFNYIDEYYTLIHRINNQQIDYSKIKEFDLNQSEKILAVHRSVLSDTNISPDFNGYIELDILPVGDSIEEYRNTDTLNYTYYNITYEEEAGYGLDSTIYPYTDIIHYTQARYLNLNTIKLLVLDSILWCGNNDQLQFLNTRQALMIRTQQPVAHLRLVSEYAFEIAFFSYENPWTKSRILSMLDLEKINNHFINKGVYRIFEELPPAIQRAVKQNKIVFIARWSP